MTAERYREANGWYFGLQWRHVVIVAVVYLVWRMV